MAVNKWVNDFQQGDQELTPDAEIEAIFNDIQGSSYEYAVLAGYKNLEDIANRLENFINYQIEDIFKELATMGAFDVNETPQFVSDYGFHWPDLTLKYMDEKVLRYKVTELGEPRFYLLHGDLAQELDSVNPLWTMGGSQVVVNIETAGYRLNSGGRLIESRTGQFVKYNEIEYSLRYYFLWRAFQYIQEGMPPELLLPREISKKLLGKHRKGTGGDDPQPLQAGALRPMLIPLLYWFDKELQMKVDARLRGM